MSARLQRRLFLCVVIALSVCGCQNGPNHSTQTSASNNPFGRAAETSQGAAGVDSRAREIERNLGVR